MKITTQTLIVIALMIFFSISCNNTEKNSNQSKDNEVNNENTKSQISHFAVC